MARLWIHHNAKWNIFPLQNDLSAISLAEIVSEAQNSAPTLVRKADDDQRQWAILARPDEEPVHVNGDPVLLGVRALHDRDAIQFGGGERIYFSTESAPVVEAYGAGKTPVACARCGTLIHPGDLSVKCGKCAAIFHQSPDLPCFTYADHCICGHPTTMNDDNCWRPDEI
jgi:hypothetical protein